MIFPSRRDKLIALGVGIAATLTLMIAQRTQGNVRDEGYYFDAAEQYYGWWGELGENLVKFTPQKSFTRNSISRWFNYNHEHPAFMKSLFGISWRIFHQCKCPVQGGRHPLGYNVKHRTIPILSEQSAMRLPTAILVGVMAALIYLWGAVAWSRGAGGVAAALSVFAPRLFFDAQMATFDAPIAALWVIVVYGYWRAIAQHPGWGWGTAALFGMALATKHNAFFLPFILAAHFGWVCWRQRRFAPGWSVFAWMGTLGVVVYLALWPWLWFDLVPRFREYLAFHVHHVYYNMEYFGRNYNKPPLPISFPYGMSLLTLPVTTMALAAVGAVYLIREFNRDRREDLVPRSERIGTGMLIGLNAIFPMAIITVTRAPIFGATKHWHASIPFLALLAGAGWHQLSRTLPEWRKRALTIAFAVVAVLPAALETARSHPYGLTHYNLLAGGPAGGADLGMNRQFWGYATRGLLPWINQHAERRAPIYWHDTNQAQLNMDVRIGILRDDVWNTGLEEPGVKSSNLAMVIHEKHFNKYEYWIWDFYGTTRPSQVLTVEGVPVVTLYERPNK